VWCGNDYDCKSTVITSQWQLPWTQPNDLPLDIFKHLDVNSNGTVTIINSSANSMMVRVSDMLERRDIWVLGGDVSQHSPWCKVKDKLSDRCGWIPVNQTFDITSFPVRMTLTQEEQLHEQHVNAMCVAIERPLMEFDEMVLLSELGI
jgi:hypothetical protein